MEQETVTRDEELEALIREQEADIRAGNLQRPESIVQMSLDRVIFSEDGVSLADRLDEDGILHIRHTQRDYGGCPIHGRGRIRMYDDGTQKCLECYVERYALAHPLIHASSSYDVRGQLRRSEKGKGNRWVRPEDGPADPRCDHDRAYFFLAGDDRIRCRVCAREATARCKRRKEQNA